MKSTIQTLSLIIVWTLSAAANTFVVNNTADPGNGVCDVAGCTLREAITAANANPGADRIEFNILPSGGVRTISPTSILPFLTESVTIDGYTQPGASENTLAVGNDAILQIELDGSSVGGAFEGLVVFAGDCTIRGLVINRFPLAGILVNFGEENAVIEGNFVGADPTGTVSLANGSGIVLSGPNGVVGGLSPASRNVVSGNTGNGVVLQSQAVNCEVLGNYIGTDASGTMSLGNGNHGVSISDNLNTVGGTTPGSGNLISGNGASGISITSNECVAQGNIIGLDATGMSPQPNGINGVRISGEFAGGSDNLIGGTTAAARNLISGSNTGVLLTEGATGNMVQGNYIGTDITGMIDVAPDDVDGVLIDDSPANLVGGTVPGAGNLISGNFDNVRIQTAGATDNLVQGNLIGTDMTGTAGIDFLGSGILLVGGSGTIIGGPSGSGNVIAFNGLNGGIAITSASSGNSIFGNSIFGNLGIGINLVGGTEDSSGVTANDFPDSDLGANNLQNYPVIEQIAVDGEARTVEGSLTSNPNTAYVLNFYSNSEVDPSGYGEGETWLGSLDVQTNAQSTVSFNFPLEMETFGRFITATATDPAGNTSEFSMASDLVPPLSLFLNISTRLRVQTGDNVLIGGFIITGNEPKEVIVRAIGPSLGGAGVADPLANPILELHYPGDTTILTNNNWREDQEAEIEATGLAPDDDLESAILVTLDPGAYTAIVRGVNGGTGVGLVETYDLSSGGDSALANISTRGLVETGDNVMIGGIIVGPDTAPSGSILLRGIGPSLGSAGIANPLADPMLELRDGNGALVTANDNWRATQEMAIEDTGLAPGDDLEAAILADLAAGAYTAILSGVGGTTGIGLVEAYHLD